MADEHTNSGPPPVPPPPPPLPFIPSSLTGEENGSLIEEAVLEAGLSLTNPGGDDVSTAVAAADVSTGSTGAAVSLTGSSLDHALLESLFYNEMALMDDFSEALFASSGSGGSSSSLLFASHPQSTVSGGGGGGGLHHHHNHHHGTGLDAEKDLLRHFGVAHDGGSTGMVNNNSIASSNSVTATPLVPFMTHHQHLPDGGDGALGVSGVAVAAADVPAASLLTPRPVVSAAATASQSSLPPGGAPAAASGYVPSLTDIQQQQRNLQAMAEQTGRRGIRHNVVAKPAASSLRHAAVVGSSGPVAAAATNAIVAAPPQALPPPRRQSKTTTVPRRSSGNNSTPNPLSLPLSMESTTSIAAPLTSEPNPVQVVPLSVAPSTAHTHGSAPTVANATTANTANAAAVADAEKRSKLVAQFATLAGRLGITLPPQVLHKLTHQSTPLTPTSIGGAATATATSLQQDAAAMDVGLIADDSVGSKRSLDELGGLNLIQSNDATGAAAAAAAASSGNSKQPYSKRRKKPRLSDCERKLAELTAENALLQSQCDQIANRNQRLDAERVAAETNMRTMMQDAHSTDVELDQAVQNFSDLYSDYGRKRHEELLFHLEQLQRLSNPTNFTKMGLWTLGGGGQDSHASATTIETTNTTSSDNTNSATGSSNGTLDPLVTNTVPATATSSMAIVGSATESASNAATAPAVLASNSAKDRGNPIAGMLQKELGISPVQGRKILDQRQKIQTVCSNLKQCFLLMGKLNALCQQKTQIFHDRMTKCREILTPRQVIKLLIWIDENSQTLGSVCPGWGSEQFQTKKTQATSAAKQSTVNVPLPM